jgi:uncharacterized phage protein (TIGR01671 family)
MGVVPNVEEGRSNERRCKVMANREILFRGKTKEHGIWAEGAYYRQTEFYGDPCEYHYIISSVDALEDNMMYYDRVLPETVGQYTGLTDKNGKKIFEGDIVKTETDLWHGEDKKERVTRIGKVIYNEKFCQFGLNIKGFSKCFILKRWKGDFNEVIGNIHDNPELLKGGEE